ncbi:MAG: SGNH/GDSL hydrolase family protein [Salibacteraceae bacterium]|nr:SGNH/GDSL hydrolase family protein [Salibacteraceae bacterium]MDP4934129.1 SGNH/GDSL hydrolase family protein [Salibacteraceae bacterium]
MAQKITLKSPVKFLALGDSYTIGESVGAKENWPHQFIDSINASGIEAENPVVLATTGWRTDDLMNAINDSHLASNFNLVSISIGVNNQYQGKPFSLFETELPVLFGQALRHCNNDTTSIFFVSIPDYYFTPFGLSSKKGKTNSTELDQYNTFMNQFAEKMHVPFIDVTSISRNRDEHLTAKDGLHPSAFQYSKWVSEMLKSIKW